MSRKVSLDNTILKWYHGPQTYQNWDLNGFWPVKPKTNNFCHQNISLRIGVTALKRTKIGANNMSTYTVLSSEGSSCQQGSIEILRFSKGPSVLELCDIRTIMDHVDGGSCSEILWIIKNPEFSNADRNSSFQSSGRMLTGDFGGCWGRYQMNQNNLSRLFWNSNVLQVLPWILFLKLISRISAHCFWQIMVYESKRYKNEFCFKLCHEFCFWKVSS